MSHVFKDVTEERDRQDQQWGGPEHDDTHSYADWVEYLGKQLAELARVVLLFNRTPERVQQYRVILVKIAALAVAAIESLDRKSEQ